MHDFEDYSEFAEWAEENGYVYDNELHREEQSHKRSVLVFFYMKKIDSDSYAQVSYVQDYDHGSSDFTVQEGFKKVEEVVTITKFVQ